jgi:hypothetical protein
MDVVRKTEASDGSRNIDSSKFKTYFEGEDDDEDDFLHRYWF